MIATGTFSRSHRARNTALIPGIDQERVLFLVLGTPDLEHGEGVVPDLDLSDLDLRAGRMHDLLDHVAVAARALVVNALDRVLLAQFHAGADHAVQFLFHLRVAALHGVEVELGDVLALDHGRGCAAAHADAVGRSPHLDHEHSLLCFGLVRVAGVHLADAA